MSLFPATFFITLLCSNSLNINQNYNDIQHFVDDFNNELINNDLNSFENINISCIKNVANIDSKERNTLICFEGDVGYILIDKNQRILSYSSTDSNKELVNNEHLLFEFGEFYTLSKRKVETKRNNYDKDFVYRSNQSTTEVIEYSDLSTFINSKYGAYNLNLFSADKLDGMESYCNTSGYTANSESVYIKRLNNGNYLTEGNCGLVSTSNILSYYARYGAYSKLPPYNSMVDIHPERESIYTLAANNSYTPKNEIVSIHEIYSKERSYAIEKGYVTSGMDDSTTEYVVESTLTYYGYESQFITYSSYSLNDITSEINNNRPLQLRVINDSCYHGHGMMVTGYLVYTGVHYVGPFMVDIRLVMLSIYDGHSHNERWYDLTYLSNFDVSYSRAESQTIAKVIIS